MLLHFVDVHSCDSCQLQCLLAVVACYLTLLHMLYDFYVNIVEHMCTKKTFQNLFRVKFASFVSMTIRLDPRTQKPHCASQIC